MVQLVLQARQEQQEFKVQLELLETMVQQDLLGRQEQRVQLERPE